MSTTALGWYWSDNKEEFQLAKIAEKDRATHFYVIGATGTGKTKFLEYLIQQDINKRNGFGVIDPHGDLIEDVKSFLATQYDSGLDAEIVERIILIDPCDPNFTVTFNPLERVANVSVAEQVNELVSSFKKIWSDSWGVRMEDLMRNTLLALSEAGLTLTDLPQFLRNRTFRKGVLAKVKHPIAIEYFQRFNIMTDRSQMTWIEPVMNKVNAFFADDRIRQMFSSNKSTFNIREIMDSQKVLLIKLDKGKLKDSANLLGSLLMAKVQMAAFSRSDLPQKKRIPFYLYIDEFQNFANESFSVILSEARKYGLSLIMAHQSLAQIPNELRNLILGNTGIQAYFRMNRQDAQLLAKEAFEYSGFEVKYISSFRPKFWSLGEEWEHHIEQLQSLPPRYCFVKHKIEGGVIPIQTVEIDPAHEFLGLTSEEFQKYLKNIQFGRKYLIRRDALQELAEKKESLILEVSEAKSEDTQKKDKAVEPLRKPRQEKLAKGDDELSGEESAFLIYISEHPDMFVTSIYKDLKLSGYKGDKIKKNLLEREYIFQKDTKKGKKGRLAKTLFLSEKGVAVLKKISQPGKGGEFHKHLQMMIKDQAEVFGWKAKIEEKIPSSLGSVDIGLRKGDIRIAVEISSTTGTEQEIQNIRKCLEAGYDYVISVSDDEKSLQAIKFEARKAFMARERERIRFYPPEQVKHFLSHIDSDSIDSEKGIVSGQIKKQKELMGTEEASEFLGIKKPTLYEWVIQRKIPFIKVGRLTKFSKADLQAWLDRRKKEEEDFFS